MTDPLTGAGLVPVITIDRAEDAGSLAAALMQGGIRDAEITFRTSAAAEAIDACAPRRGDGVGAGRVLTLEQATSTW